MGAKTLTMPEDALVGMLKSLHEKTLLDIFWKTVVQCDTSALRAEEKEDRRKAREELKQGLTVKWNALR